MASIPFKKVKLSESDISGGTLPRPPDECSAAILRKFVSSRGYATATLRKQELIDASRQILANNVGVVDDAEKGRVVVDKARVLRAIDLNAHSAALDVFPINGWKLFPSRDIPNAFHYGSVYNFLVQSAAIVDSDGEMDGLHYGTKKPLSRGRLYFRSGHVSNLQDAVTISKRYCVKGVVKSSMRELDYTVMVMVGDDGEVLDAECHCRGSALQRCSHVAAVLIAVEDYTSLFGYSPPSCTSRICQWNQGAKTKRADPVYQEKYSNVRDPSRAIQFNTNVNTEPMRVNNALVALSNDVAVFPNGNKWLTILDYWYEDYVLTDERKAVLTEMVAQFKESLTFGFTRPSEVPGTREQSSSLAWQGLRRILITASVAKRFTSSHGNTAELLRNHLWFPASFSSKFTAWGIKNENTAKAAYQRKTGNSVTDCGLWINPAYPGLAASPDGIVFCEETSTWGVLEIKCPYTLKDHPPTAFNTILTPQQKRAFCLKEEEGRISLKQNHGYFHQIQMLMGVVNVLWCDFVIWTPKGMWHDRIAFNPSFWHEISQKLSTFHERYLCVEYFEMRTPRRLAPLTLN